MHSCTAVRSTGCQSATGPSSVSAQSAADGRTGCPPLVPTTSKPGSSSRKSVPFPMAVRIWTGDYRKRRLTSERLRSKSYPPRDAAQRTVRAAERAPRVIRRPRSEMANHRPKELRNVNRILVIRRIPLSIFLVGMVRRPTDRKPIRLEPGVEVPASSYVHAPDPTSTFKYSSSMAKRGQPPVLTS